MDNIQAINLTMYGNEYALLKTIFDYRTEFPTRCRYNQLKLLPDTTIDLEDKIIVFPDKLRMNTDFKELYLNKFFSYLIKIRCFCRPNYGFLQPSIEWNY